MQRFTAEVTDPPYGGPAPDQVKELMEAILRRTADWPTHGPGENGAEDVSSRLSGKGTLIGTFIADQKHPFFEGDTFHSVLRAGQAQPRRFKVYEKAGTLRISVQDVKNVQVAKVALEGVVGVKLVV